MNIPLFARCAPSLIGLAAVAGLGACSTTGSTSATSPGSTAKALATVRVTAATSRTNAAGTFSRIAGEPTTNRWLLLSGTQIAPNAKPLDLSAVGATVTLEARFQAVGGLATLHGYGFKFLSDAAPKAALEKNSYCVFFEEPNRLDIYRKSDGAYRDINTTRPVVTVQDGAAHTLRVVVTHTERSRIDIATFIDGHPSSSGRDTGEIYTAGTWGPANLSNVSVAAVTIKPALVSVAQAVPQPAESPR